jgi:hypothetical protein
MTHIGRMTSGYFPRLKRATSSAMPPDEGDDFIV